MRNILVTGGTGYIGSHTVVELLERGDNVIIVDNLSNSKIEVLDAIKEITNKEAKFYNINYLDREALEKAGLVIAGTSPDGQLVEIVEMPSHPYFIAAQFHPEFKSRPDRPAPLFSYFIKSILASWSNLIFDI